MLRVNRELKVWWPVMVGVPRDGGTVEQVEVQVQYKLLSRTQAREMLGGDMPPEDVYAKLAEYICDWKGFADEDGEELAYSTEMLTALLEVPYIERALSTGLLQATAGASAKNS